MQIHHLYIAMRKIILPFIGFILTTNSLQAQTQQGTVEMDAIAFVRDSGKVQLEIYYTLLHGVLRFDQRGNTQVAEVNARAEIWRNGQVIASKDIKKENIFNGTRASLDSLKNSLVLDGTVITSEIKPNDEAVLIFRSKNDKDLVVFDTIKRNFYTPVANGDKFFLSGIEFANSLVPTNDHTNPFEKVGYLITPNPSKVFGSSNSRLNYYTELYIPKSAVASSGTCEVITRVLDGQKHEMFSNSHQQVLAASTIPLVGSIDVDGLPTDSYILEIAIKRGGNIETTVQKVFFYDSGMKLSEDESNAPSSPAMDEESIFSSSEISKMSELELEEKGDQAMYIAPSDLSKAWKKIHDASRQQRFLFQFWRSKDKEEGSSTPLSAYRVFYKNVDEANKKYTYQRTPGWKTDRGRIYITYGAPEERYVVSQLHTTNAKPYITWEYFNKKLTLTTGSHPIFAFVDIQGGGKFVLVHSNVQGETYEPNWYYQEAKRTN